MATAVPEIQNTPGAPAISGEALEKLEAIAKRYGWSLDEALNRSLGITEIVLDAKQDPSAQIFLYRDGHRYRLDLE